MFALIILSMPDVIFAKWPFPNRISLKASHAMPLSTCFKYQEGVTKYIIIA